MADWTRDEVEATVADYFAMLRLEMLARPYVKADHNLRLRGQLQDRTKASVEFKHQNISAVLTNIGLPYIPGYKPKHNYQHLLEQVVLEFLEGDRDLFLALSDSPLLSPTKPGAPPDDIDKWVEAPPEGRRELLDTERAFRIVTIDFVERDAANRQLGRLGEEWVLEYEARRLHDQCRRPDLAKRIEWSSQVRGDGLGYDIVSFEVSGSTRLIEVKTTGCGKAFPFYVSPNEVRVSERERQSYHLYRVFEFATRPRMYTLQGALREHCALAPSQYRAYPK
jgi:Domain of unknown function (DUF3883)